MLLRNGKFATTNEDKSRRGYTRRMEKPPDGQNPPGNNGEPPPTSTPKGSTVAVSAAELVPSTENLTPTRSRAHSGPILSYVPQAPPVNPLETQGPLGTPLQGEIKSLGLM